MLFKDPMTDEIDYSSTTPDITIVALGILPDAVMAELVEMGLVRGNKRVVCSASLAWKWNRIQTVQALVKRFGRLAAELIQIMYPKSVHTELNLLLNIEG